MEKETLVVAVHERTNQMGYKEVYIYSDNINCLLKFGEGVDNESVCKEIRQVLIDRTDNRDIVIVVIDSKSLVLAHNLKQQYSNTLNIETLNLYDITKMLFSIKGIDMIMLMMGINKIHNPNETTLVARDTYLLFLRIRDISGECMYSLDVQNLLTGKYEKYLNDEKNKKVLNHINLFDALLHYLKTAKKINSTKHKIINYTTHISSAMHIGRSRYSGNFSELYIAKSLFYKKTIPTNARTITLNRTLNANIPSNLNSFEALEYLRTGSRDYWDFKNGYVDEADKLERRLSDILAK